MRDDPSTLADLIPRTIPSPFWNLDNAFPSTFEHMTEFLRT